MATERNPYGLNPESYELAEKRLMLQIAEDRDRPTGENHFPSNILENKDVVYGIAINMMSQLNLIGSVLNNPEKEKDLKKAMDDYKSCDMKGIEKFLSNKNFSDEVEKGIANYLHFKSKLKEHMEAKKGK